MLQFDLVEVDVKLWNHLCSCQSYLFGFLTILIFMVSTFETSHLIQTRLDLCPILIGLLLQKIVLWCCYCYWILHNDINFIKVAIIHHPMNFVLQSRQQAAAKKKTQYVNIPECMVYIHRNTCCMCICPYTTSTCEYIIVHHMYFLYTHVYHLPNQQLIRKPQCVHLSAKYGPLW